MRRFYPLVVVLASFSFAGLLSAQVATDPVGFITLTVTGTTNGNTGNPSPASSALSYLGLGFTRPVAYQATLTGASGTTLTDSNSSWSSDTQFTGSTNNNYIELTSGSGAGRMSQITAMSATNHTLTTADDLSSFVSSGTGYKIRPNWTLASVFGATNSAGLQGGSATTADQVLVLDAIHQTYSAYYFSSSANSWRKTTDPFTDASNGASVGGVPSYFKPWDGLLVKRFQATDVTFSLAGAVKLGQTALPVATNLNILSNVYPSGTFTLNSSGIAGSGFTDGTATSGDEVLLFNPVGQKYTAYVHNSTGWYTTTNPFTEVGSSTNIPFGQAILIKRIQNRSAFTWVPLQPFPNQ